MTAPRRIAVSVISRIKIMSGLDISEHGMYGYPEQFIPAPELVGDSALVERLRLELHPDGGGPVGQ